MRALALVAVDAGRFVHAAMRDGYANAEFALVRMNFPSLNWITDCLHDALRDFLERAVYEAKGAASSRQQIMALLTDVER